jgi:hypothetical protein
MVGVMFVITDLIFGMVAAIVTTALVALGFVLLWFVLPYHYPDNDD